MNRTLTDRDGGLIREGLSVSGLETGDYFDITADPSFYKNATSLNYTLISQLDDYPEVTPMVQNFTLKIYEDYVPEWNFEEI